ncbi:hypothetical protein T440DRAFT_28156 [Plenodomus tracheiphilus IPT5]|uniref:Uncharacterized protein n=1 Tax=Plenodomus tracheiphilus IPT5 TaxID=1408161 RepID=A0A6A7BB05_9PLEO|nr:hypothetical protein T440DRAFT_28156 [Plenodomus tracheiphilus IPT5]
MEERYTERRFHATRIDDLPYASTNQRVAPTPACRVLQSEPHYRDVCLSPRPTPISHPKMPHFRSTRPARPLQSPPSTRRFAQASPPCIYKVHLSVPLTSIAMGKGPRSFRPFLCLRLQLRRCPDHASLCSILGTPCRSSCNLNLHVRPCHTVYLVSRRMHSVVTHRGFAVVQTAQTAGGLVSSIPA